MIERVTIFGAKSNSGITNTGFKFDSTKLFILRPIESDSARGFFTIETSFGDSSNYQKFGLASVNYPVQADIDISVVSRSNGFPEFRVSSLTLVSLEKVDKK